MSDDWQIVSSKMKKANTKNAAGGQAKHKVQQRSVEILQQSKPTSGTRLIPKSSSSNSSGKKSASLTPAQPKYWNSGNRRVQMPQVAAKLDKETDELKHVKIPLDVAKLIAQGRLAKGLSQKDLGTRINEKAQVIGEYEAGRAIPNHDILQKIQKVIGIKLLGKDRGTPFAINGKEDEKITTSIAAPVASVKTGKKAAVTGKKKQRK